MTVDVSVHLKANSNSSTSCATGTGTTSASGSTFNIFVSWYRAAGSASVPATIVDSKLNTYTLVGSVQTSGSDANLKAALYECVNGTGGAAHTFTVTFSAAQDVISLWAEEITGGPTTGIRDLAPGFNDDTASPYTSLVAGITAQANELVLCYAVDLSSSGTDTITWSNGFASIDDITDANNAITGSAAKRLVNLVGSYQGSYTSAGAGTTAALVVIITYKDTTSGATSAFFSNDPQPQRRAAELPSPVRAIAREPWVLPSLAAPAALLPAFDAGRTTPSRPSLPNRQPANDVPGTAITPPALTSIGWLDMAPPRSLPAPQPLRLQISTDGAGATETATLLPLDDYAPAPRRCQPIKVNRPAAEMWALAALIPLAIAFEFCPAVAKAAPSSARSVPDAGQALKPLQPFPAGGWLPDATLPRDAQTFNPNKQPTPPDGAATLAPVQPFPSQRYLPTADLPVDARPTPAGVRPLPPDQGYLLPLPTALLASFDAAPAPARPEIVTTKQPSVNDGSTLAPLQPFPSQSYLPTADLPIDGRVPGPKKPAAPDGSALAPLQPFPSTTYLPTADLPVDGRVPGPKQPAVPDGSALSPLQPFPSAAYLSTADLPVVGKVPGPKQPASPDGSALTPLQPFPAGGWLPESSTTARAASPTLRRVSNDAPPPALVVATLLPWFDPTPPPLHRETTTKQPPAPDPAILTRLPFVVSAWADFAPPPVSKPTKTRGAFSADPSILAALSVPVLSAWSEFSPRPIASKQNATTRPADAGQALSPLPFVPGWQPPVELPARAAPTTQGRSFDSGQALKPLQPFPVAADFDLAPAPAKAPPITARAAVAVETPPPALATTLPAFFDLSPQPQRGRMPGDPPLPQPWFLAPLAGPAPSAWGDFAPAPVRGTLFAVRAPASPVWNLPGFASALLVPFIDSSEVVFNPTFTISIVVPFIPSTTVVPPPSFQNAILPPFLSATGGVFAPEVLRRPDQMAELLSGGTSTIMHEGSSGKLYLIPLDQIDARQRALRVLRRFISLLTFRREVAPGEEEGRAFRIGVDQILLESPKDAGGEANLPTVAFLPGSGVTDTLGIGGINILDDTLGVEGDGTAVAKYGEYSEQITIEIVAASVATRNGLVAGLKQAFRTQLEWNTLLLNIPEYFGNIVEFNLDTVEYIEEAYADQNRRRAQLKVTLVVPELFVVRGFPLLDPRVLLELGAELVIETQVDVDET